MRIGSLEFREVWLLDFEFAAAPGERPDPLCLVAHELTTGRRLSIWQDDLRQRHAPPYPIGPDSLVVAYYASAEIGCHLALGWPIPHNMIDLYPEFRNYTNGKDTPCGNGLLGALSWYGLDALEAAEKEQMRALAQRGGPWTEGEREALLGYCTSDVSALGKLFRRMLPSIDVPRALLRGRYMAAAAHMEHVGVPIDTDTLTRLRAHWGAIPDRIIQQVDAQYGVFDGRTFRADRWAGWLAARGIPWPRLPSGALALDDDTFR